MIAWRVVAILFLSSASTHIRGQELSAGSCEPHGCILPGEGTSPPVTTASDAVLDARCLEVCAEVISNTSLAVSSILASVSCNDFQKVMECRLGCVTMGKNLHLSTNQCRNECLNSCIRDGCNDVTARCGYSGSTCTRICRRPSCKRGCQLHSDELSMGTLSSPVTSTPPILDLVRTVSESRRFDAGVFDVTYVNGSDSDNSNSTNITGYIFRVEENITGIYFIVQASLRDPLDLGFFACREINVSFATISTSGLSDFTPATEITVHGETRVPSQVNLSSIRFPTIEEDTRPGFLGRAVLHISWKRPEGCEYLTHYVLSIFSQAIACGGVKVTYDYTIDRDSTSYIVRADHPNAAPSFGSSNVFSPCRYIVFLQSQPVRLANDRTRSFVAVFSATQPPAPLNLSCHKFVNKTTGSIAFVVTWEIKSENVSLEEATLEAIGSYSALLLQQDDPQTLGRPLIKDALSLVGCNENFFRSRTTVGYFVGVAYCNRNGSGYYQVFGLRPFNNPRVQYRIRFSPLQNRRLFWRRIPGRQECVIDALPEPPATVDAGNITIGGFELNGTVLFLNMSWTPPPDTYGTIQQYQVRVGAEVLMQGEENYTNIASPSYVNFTDGSTTSIVVTTDDFYTSDETLCLNVQIRSQNPYLWSSWSEPVAVPRNRSVLPNCTYAGDMHPDDMLPVYTHIYVIVAVGICAALLLILCIVVVAFLAKNQYRKWQIRNTFNNEDLMWIGGSSGLSEATLLERLSKGLLQDEWELPPDHVVLEEELGEGCFGKVLKGFVRGPVASSRVMKNSLYETVAIKFLKTSANSNERKDFLNEIDMMKKIAKGNSPHIVSLIGCVTVREPLCLITEFLKYGDLLSYLHTIRNLVLRKLRRKRRHDRAAAAADPTALPAEHYLGPQSSDGSIVPEFPPMHSDSDNAHISGDAVFPAPGSLYADLGEVEPVNLISFAYQIASGMEYLSSLDIVHRDLACRNILVGEGKKLKISDFGMSRTVEVEDPIYVKTSKGKLPWKWMAIESIVDREFTSASDAWAYGVTLWEISTLGGFPYPSVANEGLLEHLQKGYRLECPENCSREVYELMLDCWSESSANRPTFTQLKDKFDALLLAENNSIYIQFSSIDTDTPSGYDHLEPPKKEEDHAEDQSEISYSSVTLGDLSTSGYDVLDPPEPYSDSRHHGSNPYVKTPKNSSRFSLEELTAEMQPIIDNSETDDTLSG